MEERSGQMMGSELKLLYTGKIRRGGGGSSPQFFFVNFPPALYCHERLKQARTSRLVSLAFSRQTGFFSSNWFSECQHPGRQEGEDGKTLV